MQLSIKNIGKLKEADIKIESITVIAGENNTGKSTVGKALFSVFNSFYKKDQRIDEAYINSIIEDLELFDAASYNSAKQIFYHVLENKKQYLKNKQELDKFILSEFEKLEIKTHYFNTSTNIKIQNIINILEIPRNDFFKNLLQRILDQEFNSEINNIHVDSNGSIILRIKEILLEVTINYDKLCEIINDINLSSKCIYIDNPFVLDELEVGFFSGFKQEMAHEKFLKTQLRNISPYDDTNIVSDILLTKKLNKIFKKINTVCPGEMIKLNQNFKYKDSKNKTTLNIKNISAGLKTFVIIKTLLENGTLEENGTLILDEPEIHLHPEWQLLFAEIIVLLQKEFNMHILINTHSPYFLEAIEVYAKNYEIKNTHYYLAKNISEFESIIEDVTDNTSKIYDKLAQPFQDLENARYK